MNILITGGASGLGEAITRKFAQSSGNSVFFTYSNSQVNADQITAEFENATSIKCNFKTEKDIDSLIEQIDKLDLDVLVNNAYCSSIDQKHFHKISSDTFLSDFKDNVIPTIQITQAVIQRMRKKKSGRIITILSSALINVPPIGYAVYISNKAYIESLTKVWANENSKFNITSNSVSPSFMQTKLNADVDSRIVESMIDSHPQKQLVKTTEVADTVAFLANSSSQINGVNMVMNAGVNIK